MVSAQPVRPRPSLQEPDLGHLRAWLKRAADEPRPVDHGEMPGARHLHRQGSRDLDVERGLFADLADHRRRGILAALHPSPGKPPGRADAVGVPGDEDAAVSIVDDRDSADEEMGIT